MASWKVRLFLATALVAMAAGCDGANGYPEGQHQPAADVTLRTRWTAHEVVNIVNAERAFDGNPSAAATTTRGYQGATLTIDLGKISQFNMIVLYHGAKEMGFARRVSVSISIDGKNFRKRFDGPGTRRVSIFSLVAPSLARYVRLEVTQPGTEPWSIGEIYVR